MSFFIIFDFTYVKFILNSFDFFKINICINFRCYLICKVSSHWFYYTIRENNTGHNMPIKTHCPLKYLLLYQTLYKTCLQGSHLSKKSDWPCVIICVNARRFENIQFPMKKKKKVCMFDYKFLVLICIDCNLIVSTIINTYVFFKLF